jgi:fatty-acyl-CoA synthase
MESYTRGPEVTVWHKTIDEVFRETVQRFPEREAIVLRHQGIRLTWNELDHEVDRAAAGLRALGLQAGDRAGVWATNCLEWVVLQFGCARAGVVQVNVNPAYRSHDLAFVLRKSGMKAIFLHEADRRSNYGAILEEARAGQDLPLEHVVYLGSPAWRAFLRDEGSIQETLDPDSPINIQYTSGTTGNPKGVLLSHVNLINNARFIGVWMRLTEADRICIPVPLYHCFGCVGGTLVSAATGATMVFPAPSFDPLATLEAIHEERATVVYGVPTMFIAQLDHPEFSRFDLTSLRTGIMAGAPCPVEVMKRVVSQMHCSEMTIAYGQTESSPLITMSPVDASVELRCSTVGCTFPATEVRIIDPASGQTVPVGQQGELITRGYLVMKGYDKEPEATARAVDADGWLHTGDLATMRPDGYFRITGRARDLIIRGGENIYPREIEEFLYTHPKVSDVQVVGLPDPLLGETVAAWVRLKPGETETEEGIKAYCRDRIAHYKIPAYIRIVDAFPMTVTGKVQKYRIRQMEIQERGLDKAAKTETA